MEFSSYIVWNILLSLVVAPVLYGIRSNTMDLKRIDILLNRTREEIGKDYISKATFERDLNRVMKLLEKLEQRIEKQHMMLESKIDRLIEK